MTLVNLCMITDEKTDRVLVLDKVHPKWGGLSFPGGKVLEGESIADSVVREVREETGLTVSRLRLCGIVHWAPPEEEERKLLFLYKAGAFSGELCSSKEGEVFWLERSALFQRKLSPNMDVFLRLYEDETLWEAFSLQANDTNEQLIWKEG